MPACCWKGPKGDPPAPLVPTGSSAQGSLTCWLFDTFYFGSSKLSQPFLLTGSQVIPRAKLGHGIFPNAMDKPVCFPSHKSTSLSSVTTTYGEKGGGFLWDRRSQTRSCAIRIIQFSFFVLSCSYKHTFLFFFPIRQSSATPALTRALSRMSQCL